MPLPLRSIVALGVVGVLAALVVWIVVQLTSSPPQSVPVWIVGISAILVLTAMALWIVFVLPAYWD